MGFAQAIFGVECAFAPRRFDLFGPLDVGAVSVVLGVCEEVGELRKMRDQKKA